MRILKKLWRSWTIHKKVLLGLIILTAASNIGATVFNIWFYIWTSASLIIIDFTLFGIWTWTGSIYNEEEKKKIPRFANRER